jgi:DNA-binding HxlR family transcriptional regulator
VDDFQTFYDAVKLCGHRWTLEIMSALQQQPMRFTDLLQTIQPRPSSKSLNEALRRLQNQGLVCRLRGADRGLYQLTPAGHHLLPLVMAFVADLRQWTKTYRDGSEQQLSARAE